MRLENSIMRLTSKRSESIARHSMVGVSRTMMLIPRSGSLAFFVMLLGTIAQLSEAYPSAMIVFHHPSAYTQTTGLNALPPPLQNARGVSKRAFDRLDMSPFDFEALSKRFNDDDDYYRKKKAFDRLDENGFFGMLRKRRAFDRLDDNASFMLGRKRRSVPGSWPAEQEEERSQLLVAKRPFDRLDVSSFGMSKKSEQRGQKRMSIAQVLEQYPEFFQQPEAVDQSK
uniref:Uncharacterized protein n=1 Tax=Ditylenchus dipsaci TaxID=166011 RepID=A0A915CKY6_9BILA